jgi:hypothetical protein
MKSRKAAVIIGGLALVFMLQGCGAIPAIQYQGKERPIEEVEEMIADYLESENPDLEFDVNITESIDE